MAGALTERAFVETLERSGFRDVDVVERTPYGVDDLAHEPLFGPDLIALMRRLLPPAVQQRVGVRIVVVATTPAGRAVADAGSAEERQ